MDRAIAGDYTRDQLGELHKLVYILARGYVRMRSRNGQLPLRLLGLCEADVVHDCIAEIFTRNGTGELVEISRYFSYRRVTPGTIPGEKLTAHLRNLVFTVAGDNIFRMLNEADPALGKVIRNLKLAVQKSDDWTMETRFEDKVLVLRCHDGASHRDGVGPAHRLQVPPEDHHIEPVVYEAIARHREIPALMSCLADKLRNSERVCQPIPIISLAVMIKQGYERHRVADDAPEATESGMDQGELAVVIGECCDAVDRSMRNKYVGRGRVNDEIFTNYIAALRQYYVSGLALGGDPHPAGRVTHFDSLQAVLPSLSREEYSRNHRTVFEYLARQVKACLRNSLSP